MDPISAFMAASLSTKAMVVGTGLAAVGAIQGGQAAKAQAEAQAKASEYNASLTKIQADVARQQAGAREEQQRRGARQVMGRQRAAIAQSGVGFIGSALDISEQSAANAELDALTTRYQGELAARGLLAQAEGDLYGAKVQRVAGKQAQTAGYLQAGSSLLTGYGKYKEE